MHTNGGCRCPVVGDWDRHNPVSFDDRRKLITSFDELKRQVRELQAKLLVSESTHKSRIERLERGLYNVLSALKSQEESAVNKANIKRIMDALLPPGGIAAIAGALKDDDE